MRSLNLLRRHASKSRSLKIAGLVSLLTLGGLLSIVTRTVTAQSGDTTGGTAIVSVPPGSAYRQTNLLSDIPGLSPVLDPLLVNPWGISATASSPFWVANNGTSTTQLIRGDVGGAPVVLNTSPQTINIPGGLPTGTVNNSTTDFKITPPGGGTPAAAVFIFDSITGNITAWNGSSGSAAQNVVSMPGHTWTGLAIGSNSGGNRLYAADFANNHIDVFDQNFAATTVPGGFTHDAGIPAGYAPFNIQAFGSGTTASIYVTYAKVGLDGKSEDGVGFGYVRKFSTDGVQDPLFAIDGGNLDAPWGLAIAPASFGVFGGSLLVGNFGEGTGSIHAYNPTTGAPSATDNALKDESNNDIVIDELWALRFGNGVNGGDVNTLYFSSGIGEEEHGLFGKLNPTTATATSLIQFGSTNYFTDEAGGHIDITVVRNGDTSGTATVNYNTFDESQAGHASQKSDYEISLGKLTFNPGETSKTFRILLVDDTFVEGDETISLALSNPTGTGVGLGSPNMAEVTILDNDTVPPTTEPLNDPSFYVRQQYLDLFNREPDSGQAAFVNQITACGSNQPCKLREMLAVATTFFTSDLHFGNGSLVYRTWQAAFGPSALGGPAPVLYGDFERDLQAIQKNVTPGAPGADAQLEANKQAYFNSFILKPQFVAKYPTTQSPSTFVDALYLNAGVTPSAAERTAAINEFGGASDTSDQAARARVLRRVAENAAFAAATKNSTFVALEYFSYLRRDPDTAGFNFWLSKLNSFGGDINRAAMIRAFITSSEYGQRFGPSGITTFGNAAPDAVNDSATTNANTPVTINVLANDIDYDGHNISLVSVTPGTGGTPAIGPGSNVTFTPSSGFVGTANFTYTITDGFDTDTATVTVNVISGGTFLLSGSALTVNEGAGKLTVTVTRTGDTSVPASVDYATAPDGSVINCTTVNGHASERCDYETALGTLKFGAGEASKTFDIFVIDDAYVEGPETFSLTLSNPQGTNFTLGGTTTATVTITDNDSAAGPNPIDQTAFFVRQHYLDFLNREPDPPGLAGWINTINTCPAGNTTCDRVQVSSSFYRSAEFQQRGYFLYRFYAASLGRKPSYQEFMMDMSRVSGFLTDAQLELNRQLFIIDFMNRTEFKTKYDPTIGDPTAYVNLLESTAGVTLPNKTELIAGLQAGTETRASVLDKVIQTSEVYNKFFNEAFVVEAYFGYLRRDPDALFTTWISQLNSTGDFRALVNGFVNSLEYRQRFGTP